MRASLVFGSIAAALGVASALKTPRAKQPNIVFIITDDQDKELDSMDYLPKINQYLTQQGTTYDRHYCTVALCCPSRVSLLTGLQAHNHNVTDVVPPFGEQISHDAKPCQFTPNVHQAAIRSSSRKA